MGWKSVKEHYRIGHIVHVTKSGLCIGSPYVSDLIVVAADGTIVKRGDYHSSNVDLARYIKEFEAAPARLAELIARPDTFGPSVTIYTYDGGEIIEKQCESPVWPGVTHDGCLIYENTFSTDKAKIVAAAKRNAEADIEAWQRKLKEANERVAECARELAKEEADLAKLNEAYP